MKSYMAGSSRGSRSDATLLLQMARAAAQQAEVAQRIRELRGRMTQPAIAERVGVTLRAYQAWEAGGGIGGENLARLAAAFDVTEEYILYGPDQDKPPRTQMDRVERKLDAILEHLGVSSPDDPAADLERELANAVATSSSHGASNGSAARAPRRGVR